MDQNKCSKRQIKQEFVRTLEPSQQTVDISPLQVLVRERFPAGAPLSEILLNEKRELPIDVFLNRYPVWLKLSELKSSR